MALALRLQLSGMCRIYVPVQRQPSQAWLPSEAGRAFAPACWWDAEVKWRAWTARAPFASEQVRWWPSSERLIPAPLAVPPEPDQEVEIPWPPYGGLLNMWA